MDEKEAQAVIEGLETDDTIITTAKVRIAIGEAKGEEPSNDYVNSILWNLTGYGTFEGSSPVRPRNYGETYHNHQWNVGKYDPEEVVEHLLDTEYKEREISDVHFT